MKRLFLTFVFTPLLSLAAAQTMTPEEKIVRLTYAKLSYAAEQGVLQREVARNMGRIAKHEPQLTGSEVLAIVESKRLSFELANFKVGDIAELDKVNYSDLVTIPNQDESIGVGGHIQGFRENRGRDLNQEAADASWGTGQGGNPNLNWDVPAQGILANIENRAWYSRYATFDVIVASRRPY